VSTILRPGAAAPASEARPRGGLTGRMMFASGVLMVILGAAFGVLLLAIADLRDSARIARETRDELIEVDAVEKLVVDLETGLRGFVITREERFLAPWNEARTALPQRTGALERVVAENPEQVRRARAITRSVTSYIEDYGLPLIAAARRGERSASSVDTTEEGKGRVDSLRDEFASFRASERTLLNDRQDRADLAARRAVASGFVGVAASFILVGLFVAYLMRAIVRPIRRASDMAGVLASGDLSTRIPEEGVAEIGRLERAFNAMAGSLETNEGELRRLVAQQSALGRVATLVARRAPPDEVFEVVTREVGLLSGADLARMERYEADGTVTGVASWSKDVDRLAVGTRFALEGVSIAALVREADSPVRVDSFADASGPIAEEARALGIRSSVGCPILVAGRLWGVIAASSKGEAPFPAGIEAQIGEFTELVATGIANAESRAELAASRARVVAAGDETRRRIERDLHDGAQQRLVSLALRLRGATSAIPPDLVEAHAELARVGAELNEVHEELREISRGIHPAILSEGGLGPALRTLARRSAVPVELDVQADARLPEPVEVTAYYVVSEALTNAAKHSGASSVNVALAADDGVLRLAIRDDGVGGADPRRGSGLVGLKDRIEATGGTLTVESRHGQGTSLVAELPIDGEQAPDSS
jgi:signal transduction histidine kinase